MSRLTHLWIPVTSLERSIVFYTEKLGLQERFRLLPGDEKESDNAEAVIESPYAELETKDKKVVIYVLQNESILPPRGSIIAGFEVDNLEETITSFNEVSIPFVGETAVAGDRRMAHFQDPDGHVLQIVEMN